MLDRPDLSTYTSPMVRDRELHAALKGIFSTCACQEGRIGDALEGLACDHGDGVFQAAIGLLLGVDLDERQAANSWRNAMIRWRHQKELRPGLLQVKAALYDYLETVAGERLNSSLDGITNLYNGGYFQHHLEYQLAASQLRIQNESLALVILRMDHYDRLGWSYSQQELDQLQRQVAREIRTRLRDLDTAARLGEGEFGLILPGVTFEAAFGRVERIRIALAEGIWHRLPESVPFPATVSAGIAVAPWDGSSPRRLLHVARGELQSASRTGNSTSPEFAERRLQARHPFRSLVEVAHALEKTFLPAISCDISEIGMALDSELNLSPGENVLVRCKKPFWPINRDLLGVLRRSDDMAGNGVYRLAVEFLQAETSLNRTTPFRSPFSPAGWPKPPVPGKYVQG